MTDIREVMEGETQDEALGSTTQTPEKQLQLTSGEKENQRMSVLFKRGGSSMCRNISQDIW